MDYIKLKNFFSLNNAIQKVRETPQFKKVFAIQIIALKKKNPECVKKSYEPQEKERQINRKFGKKLERTFHKR